MYSKIMVPVDLAHTDQLASALQVAADMARLYQAEICYVGVTANTPGAVARNPDEYQQKLETFAREQGEAHGQPTSARALVSHDPAVDLNEVLVRAIKETSADLVLMATHLPSRLDALLPANGGKVATHTEASVFLVRPHTMNRQA